MKIDNYSLTGFEISHRHSLKEVEEIYFKNQNKLTLAIQSSLSILLLISLKVLKHSEIEDLPEKIYGQKLNSFWGKQGVCYNSKSGLFEYTDNENYQLEYSRCKKLTHSTSLSTILANIEKFITERILKEVTDNKHLKIIMTA